MNTKFCTCCEEDKPLSEFYTTGCRKSDNTRHYKSWCKQCETAKLRQWRKNNPDLYKEQRLRSRQKVIERSVINPEYAERILLLKRLNSRKNFISGMVSRASLRAKRLNLEFSITKQDIVIPDKCPLLNVPFKLGTKGDYQFSPSIDRIDPMKGYTKDNIKIISTLANTMKNSATKEQLLTFSENISKYLET